MPIRYPEFGIRDHNPKIQLSRYYLIKLHYHSRAEKNFGITNKQLFSVEW